MHKTSSLLSAAVNRGKGSHLPPEGMLGRWASAWPVRERSSANWSSVNCAFLSPRASFLQSNQLFPPAIAPSLWDVKLTLVYISWGQMQGGSHKLHLRNLFWTTKTHTHVHRLVLYAYSHNKYDTHLGGLHHPKFCGVGLGLCLTKKGNLAVACISSRKIQGKFLWRAEGDIPWLKDPGGDIDLSSWDSMGTAETHLMTKLHAELGLRWGVVRTPPITTSAGARRKVFDSFHFSKILVRFLLRVSQFLPSRTSDWHVTKKANRCRKAFK
jgi:hypothetical protein